MTLRTLSGSTLASRGQVLQFSHRLSFILGNTRLFRSTRCPSTASCRFPTSQRCRPAARSLLLQRHGSSATTPPSADDAPLSTTSHQNVEMPNRVSADDIASLLCRLYEDEVALSISPSLAAALDGGKPVPTPSPPAPGDPEAAAGLLSPDDVAELMFSMPSPPPPDGGASAGITAATTASPVYSGEMGGAHGGSRATPTPTPTTTSGGGEESAASISSASAALPLTASAGGDSLEAALLSAFQWGEAARSSPPLHSALVGLLQGIDLKAVLRHGAVADATLRHLSLQGCDASLLRFSRVTFLECDFSRAVFYGATMTDVIFYRCNFDSSVLKEVRCRGVVRFETCSFRFAAVGLHAVPQRRRRDNDGDGAGADSGVLLDSCDLDLSSFEGSTGLRYDDSFVRCRNTHLAYKLPLSPRSGSRRRHTAPPPA